MIDTAIYISLTRDNVTLILDGNLSLLGELLATLNAVMGQISHPKYSSNPALNPYENPEGENHAS